MRRLRPLVVALLAGWFSMRAVSAQESQDHRHDLPDADVEPGLLLPAFLDRPEFLGQREWRARLEERGWSVTALWTFDLSRPVSGGLEEGEDAFRHLFDLDLAVDMERALGLPGTLIAGYQWIGGDDGSALVGDLQGFSNIDSERRSQLARLSWGVDASERLHLELGKLDANDHFAYVEAGGRFLSSSAGFSPTILGLPTYPDSAFGATLTATALGPLEIGLGVLDGSGALGTPTGERGPSTLFGAPSALFSILELGTRWDSEGPQSGRCALGAWHQGGDLARFDGDSESGTEGMYALAEQSLIADEAQALAVFGQLGWADPALSPFETHAGLGLVWSALNESRGYDHVGLYATRVGLSDDPAAPFVDDYELALELFYSLAAAPWLRIKPDLQYIRHPGGEGLEDAWVGTIRCTVRL